MLERSCTQKDLIENKDRINSAYEEENIIPDRLDRNKRKPGIGAILGLLAPGLGFMYGGNIQVAVYYNVAMIALLFLTGWFVVTKVAYGIYIFYFLVLLWFVGSSIGAFLYLLARPSAKKPYNRITDYCLFAICILFIAAVLKTNIGILFNFEGSKIIGNVGTIIQSGDFVVAEARPNKIALGDIILYEGNKGRSVARIIDQSEEGVIVDHRNDRDHIISRQDIRGKVIFIVWAVDSNRYPMQISDVQMSEIEAKSQIPQVGQISRANVDQTHSGPDTKERIAARNNQPAIIQNQSQLRQRQASIDENHRADEIELDVEIPAEQQQSEIKRFQTLIQQSIARNWIRPPGSELLACSLEVRLFPGGDIQSVRMTKSSGYLAFDRSVENAVYKAAPLPVPAGVLFDKFRVISFEFDTRKYSAAPQGGASVNATGMEMDPPATVRSDSKSTAAPGYLPFTLLAVQVAVLASQSDAENRATELRNRGYKAFVEPTKSSDPRTLYRIRVGPEKDRRRAEETLAEIKNTFKSWGQGANLVPYP